MTGDGSYFECAPNRSLGKENSRSILDGCSSWSFGFPRTFRDTPGMDMGVVLLTADNSDSSFVREVPTGLQCRVKPRVWAATILLRPVDCNSPGLVCCFHAMLTRPNFDDLPELSGLNSLIPLFEHSIGHVSSCDMAEGSLSGLKEQSNCIPGPILQTMGIVSTVSLFINNHNPDDRGIVPSHRQRRTRRQLYCSSGQQYS